MQKQFWHIHYQHLIVSLLLWLSSPTLFATELNAAREAINQMDYTTATTQLNSYLQKHPDDLAALRLLAKTYAWDNQFAAAIKIYDKLLSRQPGSAWPNRRWARFPGACSGAASAA